MDFYRIKERSAKNGVVEVYPDFIVCRSKDLMVRGKQFYAIWDEEKGLWSTDEYDVQRLVDADLMRYRDNLSKRNEGVVQVKLLSDFSSNSWLQFRNYIGHLSDSSHQLDENLTFSNTEVKKTDYVSKRLPYPLAPGDHSAWDEIVGTLYDADERAKIEWAIGAIISGDSKKIQKFMVWYGAPGTGKGTVLDVIHKLFEGYYATFEAKTLTGASAFASEAFKSNPLIAIDPDGDLSRIEDNTRLNSIVSHEPMTINEKYKPSYTARIIAMLLIATNKPVKITDAKSGLVRRMIDIRPCGELISPRRYHILVSKVDFELGAIAHHCLEVYRGMGKDFYSGYRAVEMMLQTDVFFNYIEAYYDVFKEQNGTSLNQAYEMYKQYCEEALIEYKLPKHRFRDELRNYFDHFEDRAVVDGARVRSWYSGFSAKQFKAPVKDNVKAFSLVMDETESIFDEMMADCPAQYSKANGFPQRYWTADKRTNDAGEEFIPKPSQVVDTFLRDLDTTKEHYVKVPVNHIVIDFDLTDASGEKSIERNLEAASQWPTTYAEFSKSGAGVHLHYIYEGDATQLSRVYDDGIEVKVYTGNSSLRRRLTKCNNIPVATINSGLPIKEKKVINSEMVKSEKALRDLIMRNLRKEIHPGTKPSMSFIHKILEDAYSSGVQYDVSDMRPKILAFANRSSNHALYCIKLMQTMKFKAEVVEQGKMDGDSVAKPDQPKDDRPVFYDVEVFPNLFIICWKYAGSDQIVRMINPTPQQVEDLMKMKLVGFNCRRYDNHILYARFMGYTNEQLYKLSQRIIKNDPNALFGEAYNLSYADIYDYAATKQSLKKWQIELGIRHKELGLPWDEPVPEDMWEEVAAYCDNDVTSTEAVYEYLKSDLVARQILAELSGLSVNDTTQKHTAKIVFGNDRRPQEKFIYTDLSEEFPGYKFDMGKSHYKGEITGEGGYVYAEPGMYENVALLDIASMHPTTIRELNLFGPDYTPKFFQLVQARLAIKHGDFDSAKRMLDGKLAPYLTDPSTAKALSYALKIVINIVYGLTSAKFNNPFKDPRNVDNIVAKRGSLFMIDLKEAVQAKGFKVVHIKTDSIKIANATPEIIEFVMEFGNNYGYTFEHEETYEKFCLVNDAVYIAKTKQGKSPAHWTATGAQFKHPYVFKSLFSKEPITFRDKCEAKFVTTALYLEFVDPDAPMATEEVQRHFVGKAGLFCPIKPDRGGGILVREKDGKFHAASGTTGHFWLESEMVETLNKEADIDMSYFRKLVDAAKDTISKYGDFEQFAD